MHQGFLRVAVSTGLGFISAVLTAVPVLAAERITFVYPPFGQFSIAIKDLEIFAQQGRITGEFAFYAKRARPEQLTALQDFLGRRFDVSPVTVSQFTYSPLGRTVLQEIGYVLKTPSNQNGATALRAAFILAAADSQGLTVVNILRQFPLATVKLDFPLSLQLAGNAAQLFERRDAIVASIQQQSTAMAAANPIDLAKLPDLRQPGTVNWRMETITFTNPERKGESLDADLYRPQGLPTPAPLVVISHGVASDRNTFAYLAEHLASYGFAVAVVEHPDTSARTIERFLSGFNRPPNPSEWVNRPLDVKHLLDDLEQRTQSDPAWQGQINLQQVGVLGHSLGGYTVLALAGATLNAKQIRQECDRPIPQQPFNLAVLLQCRALDLPEAAYRHDLKDDRVKAVLAINPLTSTIFGQQGIRQIQIPVLMVSGTEDYFTPAVPEQIVPFTWLTTPEKYLVVMARGTHFSCLGGGGGRGVLPVPDQLIGPNPALARPALQAVSTAFFSQYLTSRSTARSYLNSSYVNAISPSPFGFSLVRSVTLPRS